MPSYPGTKRVFTTHVNTTEVIDATHVNDVQDEVTAIQGTVGLNPQISTAGGGSTLGAWSSASRTYASLADRIANVEAGIIGDTHTQYARLANTEVFTGQKTFSATDTFFGAATTTTSGNITLSSGTTGGQAAVTWREGTTNRWQSITTQGLTTLRLRDLVNARDHVTYTPGASNTAATTAYGSSVTVAGNQTVTGTLGVTGTSTLAALTLSGVLTLAAGTGDTPAASNPGDAAAGGTSTGVSRANHVHAREAFGTTMTAVDAAAAAAGTATTTTRSDHKHTVTVGTVVAETTFGLAASSGTATSVSRSDHTHGTPAQPVIPAKTYRIPHTFIVPGDVLATGGDNIIGNFKVPVPAGQTATFSGVAHDIASGTSAAVTVTRNGTAVGTAYTVTPTAASATASTALANLDRMSITVASPTGTPKTLSFTVFIDYSV